MQWEMGNAILWEQYPWLSAGPHRDLPTALYGLQIAYCAWLASSSGNGLDHKWVPDVRRKISITLPSLKES